MDHFLRRVTELDSLLKKLSKDHYEVDDLFDFDFESIFLTVNVVFSLHSEEQVNIFWQCLEVCSAKEELTENIIVCEIDGLKYLLYDAVDLVFVFVRKVDSIEADELINSLL